MGSPSDPNPYKTTGMGMAAYLWFRGFSILDTGWIVNGDLFTCWWTFEPTDQLLKSVEDYASGQALVDPRAFYPKVTEFKRMVYATKPNRS